MSKTSKISLLVIALLLVWSAYYTSTTYNGLVVKDEAVKTSWSQVENQYQRRADLIPNLVSTVRGYSIHEAETLEAVIEARAKATQTQVNVQDASSFSQFQVSQDSLSSALSRLMVVVEQYPELKADKSFLELQAQLEGTENRISVERKTYNETSKDYNIMTRQFPKNFVASLFGFERASLFETSNGSDQVPVVDFEG